MVPYDRGGDHSGSSGLSIVFEETSAAGRPRLGRFSSWDPSSRVTHSNDGDNDDDSSVSVAASASSASVTESTLLEVSYTLECTLLDIS